MLDSVSIDSSLALIMVQYLGLVDMHNEGLILSANHRANGAVTNIGLSS